MPKAQLKRWPGGISRHRWACRGRWKNRSIWRSQSHLKVLCTFIRILSIRPDAGWFLHAVRWAAICSVPVEWPAMSAGPGRRVGGVWLIYGLSGLFKIWPGTRPMCAMPYRTSARHRRIYCDQIAMRNAAPGFKSELKVTRCPPESPKMTRQPQGVPWGPDRKCL